MRPGRLARFVRFSAPGVGAAAAAVVAAGLFEGWSEGAPLAATLCGAGGAAALVGPVLVAASLGGRGLWRAWRPFLADGRDDGGGDGRARGARSRGARLFGGALHAIIAALAVGAVGFAAAFVALSGEGPAGGPRPSLDPLSIAALAGAASLVLLAAARPGAAALARPGARLGLHRPRAALGGAALVIAALALVVWLTVAGPALARVDYGFAGYGWTAVVVLVVAHAAAPRMARRARRLAGGGAVLACAALVAHFAAARAGDPATVFDAWYRLPVGGLALGALVDVDQLRSESAPADLAPRARPGPHPDVVLVTIDTVRADALRLHGGEAATPALERLAARGRVFEWAFAPSNNTRQSVSSIMTGLSPGRLRGRVVEFGLKLDPRHVVLAERLRAAGYDTAGFLCCPNHLGGRKKIGLDRGLAEVRYDRSGERLSVEAARWLRAGAVHPGPRYAWIHLFEPHDWKRRGARDPVGAEAAAPYRRQIERADAYLGAILDEIERSGRPTIVVVTSDHGEGLGDRGAVHHASNLYNSQIHVPLVVAGPGIPPGRDPAPVGLLDLAPTLLDLAGFDPPAMPVMDARSFAARARGGPPRPGTAEGEAYAAMIRDRSVQRSGRALVAGTYKLIEMDGKRPELYDLAADPAEARNLARRMPAVAADLRRRLDRRRAVDGEDPFR